MSDILVALKMQWPRFSPPTDGAPVAGETVKKIHYSKALELTKRLKIEKKNCENIHVLDYTLSISAGCGNSDKFLKNSNMIVLDGPKNTIFALKTRNLMVALKLVNYGY